MANFESENPAPQAEDIDQLIKQYGDIRKVSITRGGVTLTAEQWMAGWCPEDPNEVSEEEYKKAVRNIMLGQGHGHETGQKL